MTANITLILTFLTVAPTAAAEQSSAYPKASLLIEARELAKPETRASHRVLDTRSKVKYEAGHVPGAARVDAAAWSKAFTTDLDLDLNRWSRRIGDLGIDADTPVVVYGDSDTPDAARTWWLLRYWGVKNVRLLNGGWQAWKADVGEISKEEPQFSSRRPQLQPQKSRLTTMDQLLQSLPGSSVQIIDARSQGEYCGVEKTAQRNGAIPGAVHLEWKEVLDPHTRRFKSADQLTQLFQEKKIDLKRPSVTHCQSGGRAAVMAFALELMGAKDVSNYYKSWAEWGNAENTPVVKPER
ncbi:MAG TPA: sulfurtransferase [Gemmataceae bacterium]|nr:sulfurtransferase [Gemmataceae bacterium]